MKRSQLRNLIKKTIREQMQSRPQAMARPQMALPKTRQKTRTGRSQAAGPKPHMMNKPGKRYIDVSQKIKASGFSAQDYSTIFNSDPQLKNSGCPATISDTSTLPEQVAAPNRGMGNVRPGDGPNPHRLAWGALILACVALGFLLWDGGDADSEGP
jgi:hypothetical protein